MIDLSESAEIPPVDPLAGSSEPNDMGSRYAIDISHAEHGKGIVFTQEVYVNNEEVNPPYQKQREIEMFRFIIRKPSQLPLRPSALEDTI